MGHCGGSRNHRRLHRRRPGIAGSDRHPGRFAIDVGRGLGDGHARLDRGRGARRLLHREPEQRNPGADQRDDQPLGRGDRPWTGWRRCVGSARPISVAEIIARRFQRSSAPNRAAERLTSLQWVQPGRRWIFGGLDPRRGKGDRPGLGVGEVRTRDARRAGHLGGRRAGPAGRARARVRTVSVSRSRGATSSRRTSRSTAGCGSSTRHPTTLASRATIKATTSSRRGSGSHST